MRFSFKLAAMVVAVPVILAACAGTGDALFASATGNDPFKDLSLAATFVGTNKYINESAESYVAGMSAIGNALGLKDKDVNNAVKDLEAAKQGKVGFDTTQVSARIENLDAANERIAKAMENVVWEKLGPNAQKEFTAAYGNFKDANFKNTTAALGAMKLVQNANAQTIQSEVLGSLTSKVKGVTMDQLVAFPQSAVKLGSNLKSALALLEKMDDVSDFSEVNKTREEANKEASQNDLQSIGSQFGDSSASSKSEPKSSGISSLMK